YRVCTRRCYLYSERPEVQYPTSPSKWITWPRSWSTRLLFHLRRAIWGWMMIWLRPSVDSTCTTASLFLLMKLPGRQVGSIQLFFVIFPAKYGSIYGRILLQVNGI